MPWTWRSRIGNRLPARFCAPITERQFTSWAFTNKIRSAGLMPSFGTIGDGYDNAMMESFWSSTGDRTAEPEEMADPTRSGERDLRLHRNLLQPSETEFADRLCVTDPVRVTLREPIRSGLIFTYPGAAKHGSGQQVKQTWCSLPTIGMSSVLVAACTAKSLPD